MLMSGQFQSDDMQARSHVEFGPNSEAVARVGVMQGLPKETRAGK